DEKNFVSLPYSPKSIKEVVITHAHLDHSGYLPRLVKKGFHGSIICTQTTADLIKIILDDSASINRGDDEALYDAEDVKATLKLLRPEKWDHEFSFLGMKAKLIPAGHILGASSLIIEAEKRIIFSGDIGRSDDYLIPQPVSCPPSDVVIMESTYGGKVRAGNMYDDLLHFLSKVVKEKKIGIIASFAMARGQMLITLIEQAFLAHPELKLPLYFDSPMMKKVNEVYKKHNALTKHPVEMIESLREAEALDFAGQWDTLKKKSGPLLIISSSGMVSGGRIFRHLHNWEHDPNTIIFLPGYQGENTPGRTLKDGGHTIVDTEGESITWAGEVQSSEAFSSHADQNELLNWVKEAKAKKIVLIHGEEKSKERLKEKLSKITNTKVIIPTRGQTLEID
ncbi:MAG: MBL fold metallo-hydrolase, partial [Bacteriovoracaceae bacterium]|nr:MBL fold metallo-hydrolase [Bacteriovoracaceae bacterium]